MYRWLEFAWQQLAFRAPRGLRQKEIMQILLAQGDMCLGVHLPACRTYRDESPEGKPGTDPWHPL